MIQILVIFSARRTCGGTPGVYRKTKTIMAEKYTRVEQKEVWKLERSIEVNGHTSTLAVQAALNVKDATWKITANLTTVQVDPNNEEVTGATINTLADMMDQITWQAIHKRAKLLEARTGDPDQGDLFGEKATES